MNPMKLSKTNSIAEVTTAISAWRLKLSKATTKCLALGQVIDFHKTGRPIDGRFYLVVKDMSYLKAKKEQDRLRKTKIAFYQAQLNLLSEKMKILTLVQDVLDQ